MQSTEHLIHIAARKSWSDCSECRADTERRFVALEPWCYQHVHDYLTWVLPRLAAIRDGEASTNARVWYRQFRKALHTRITAKVPTGGRKHCDSYLERCGQFPRATDAAYLRQFAARGASCLDY